jgi:peptidoglycan/xylan/chitin deacetylase (PgdA/CDA1 family)
MAALLLAVVVAGCGGAQLAAVAKQPTSSAATTTMSAPVGPSSPATTSGPRSICPKTSPNPAFYAPGRGKTVALTFDDGPGASTAAIISVLESYGVPATFFNIGENEQQRAADVVAEADGGFLVGDHTWDHPDMPTLSSAAQAAEIDETAAEQLALTGLPPCVFRPPYGDYDATTLALAADRHMAVWMWSVDNQDWMADGSGAAYWVNRIIAITESEGGALENPVVIFHNQPAGNPASVEALPTIIQFFESRGYTFVDLLGRSGTPVTCEPPAGSGTASSKMMPAPQGLSPRSGPGNGLNPGQTLFSGQSISSAGGQYSLVMQGDGNLVAYAAGGRALWSTGTNGHPGARVVMQRDGDLVVYSPNGAPLWASRTRDAGARLALQADANLVVYSASGAPVWASNSVNSRLVAGQKLMGSWYLESANRQCRLVMQGDGNLVLKSAAGRVLWASGTSGTPRAVAVMQGDGNLVVYAPSGRALWSSGTSGFARSRLDLLDAAAAVVVPTEGQPIWATRP